MEFEGGRQVRVLIDADGCPVVDETIKISQTMGVEVIIFCDTTHFFERADVEVITVSKGSDAVDLKLINSVFKGDVIITQDYGLAAMGLAKKAYPINQNGLIYTEENIDQLLFKRHIGKEIRRKGGRTKGPQKRTKQQDEAFCKAFSFLLSRLLAEGEEE